MRVLGLLALLALSTALPQYRYNLPNAFSVQHQGRNVRGLGHIDPHGGGNLNQFGKDFIAAGRRWTKELCEMDSDSDGRSNGEELGDPQCKWEKGMPNNAKGVYTHPGIPNSPRPNIGGEEECFCVDYFQPACGENGKDYKSPCLARCEGVRVAHRGKCAQYVDANGNQRGLPSPPFRARWELNPKDVRANPGYGGMITRGGAVDGSPHQRRYDRLIEMQSEAEQRRIEFDATQDQREKDRLAGQGRAFGGPFSAGGNLGGYGFRNTGAYSTYRIPMWRGP